MGNGLDSFLDYSSKGSKSGGYAKNWKTSIDDDHGEITVWMHQQFMPAPFWSHPFRVVVESKRENEVGKLIVVGRRFGCHEHDAIAKLQKYRLDDGTAEHKPTVCPMCIMTSVIARMVTKGQLGFGDVVFEWKGTEDDSLVQVRAGGIYGSFRKKPQSLTREEQVAMRKAGVKQPDAFKHDMRNQLKYAFVIVDDAKVDDGLLISIESEGLANKMRAAIIAEGQKVQAMKKIDMRDDRVRHMWDPSIKPYPFLLKYDNTQDFEKKFTVVPLVGQELSDEIRALIVDAPVPEIEDMKPGNCYDLRAELESHCKVSLPWDEIFGPAEAAGLMVAPGESKAEVDEDEQRTPEISTKQEFAGDGAVKIGPDHAAWKNKAYKPGPEFKGKEVHILPPDGVTDADVDRVIAAFKAVAKDVAEIVACKHCSSEMTTFDPSCPSCGAEYSDDGKLLSRPCVNADCGHQVPLTEPNEPPMDGGPVRYICPKCATMHVVDDQGEWKQFVAVQEPPKAASPRRRRSAA